MTSTFSDLGDRQKALERAEAARAAMPGLPLLVRLDGRAFHAFTRGLARPFDPAMCECMLRTTAALVRNNHPLIAYTQSDEITLVFHATGDAQLPFGGKWQKLTSLLAAEASVAFKVAADELLPAKREAMPTFDARAWQVPSLREAIENLAWREADATKNSITMAASTLFSPKVLHGVDSKRKLDMLLSRGVNWNDYPAHFKRGTYLKRVTRLRSLGDDELARIPEKHRPAGPVMRSVVERMDWPPIRKWKVDPAIRLFGDVA